MQHFFRLEIHNAHGRISHHEVVRRVVENLSLFRSRQPSNFFIFVKDVLEQVDLVFLVANLDHNLLVIDSQAFLFFLYLDGLISSEHRLYIVGR